MSLLSEQMKAYESVEAGRRFLPLLPVVARIDGKSFSQFTRGLARPYDERLSNLMAETTEYLLTQTQANLGYTQSDEISLVWYSDSIKSQIFLDGRIQKMTSILSSFATACFNARLSHHIPELRDNLAFFDCRVWQVPNLEEAGKVFLWREKDATTNSIEMAARAHYSHKELFKKNGSEMQEMLFQKGINWKDYPDFFKRGRYFQKRKVLKEFNAEEIARLPEQHEAKRNPQLMVERSEVRCLAIPPISKVNNIVEVVFNGADPELMAN